MLRYALLLAVLLLASRASLAALPPDETSADKAEASVVMIFVRQADGTFVMTGSGFYARPGLVVSMYDGRRATESVFVKNAGSDALVAATAVKARGESRIDVFRVAGAKAAPLKLSRRAARAGEDVVAVGAPIFARAEATGKVAIAPAARVTSVVFQTGLTGESVGAPVIASDGTVLGIVARTSHDGGESFVVPAAAIAARLAGKPEPAGITSDLVPAAPYTPPVPRETPSLPPVVRADPPPNEPASPPAGAPPADRSVAAKPVILNRPRPNYTEQARTNLTQGSVTVKVLLGANGRVKSANVVQGLPDGLNEKAIEAAYQLQFTPARNAAGQPVDSWVTVKVTFTIAESPLTGVWLGAYDDGAGAVQFTLRSFGTTERRGFAVLEERPGVFTVLRMSGGYDHGAFVLMAESPAGGCAFGWTGAVAGRELKANESRSCARETAARTRTLTLASKIEIAAPVSRPAT